MYTGVFILALFTVCFGWRKFTVCLGIWFQSRAGEPKSVLKILGATESRVHVGFLASLPLGSAIPSKDDTVKGLIRASLRLFISYRFYLIWRPLEPATIEKERGKVVGKDRCPRALGVC